MRATTLTTHMQIFGALVGLGMFLISGSIAQSDDATDWANQQAQAQKEREQAERDQQERTNWYAQQAQAQKERDDWYNQQAQAQKDREQAERDRQDRENWANQIAQNQRERDEFYRQQAQTQKEREDWQNYQAQVQRDADQVKKDRELNEWYTQQWKAGDVMMKWATDQNNARQEAINRGEWGLPTASTEMKQPKAALALAATPALPSGLDPARTHIVTIRDGLQARQQVFVMHDDGTWHDISGSKNNSALPVTPRLAEASPGPLTAQPMRLVGPATPKPFDPWLVKQTVRQNQDRLRQQTGQHGVLRLGGR